MIGWEVTRTVLDADTSVFIQTAEQLSVDEFEWAGI